MLYTTTSVLFCTVLSSTKRRHDYDLTINYITMNALSQISLPELHYRKIHFGEDTITTFLKTL